ncbi:MULTISPECIES: hypothetical protein [unclassified Streptomyces]|uniref:hypothetical protein n=1 Tax=unclassified Streptomyces TaxID=2593676 RepID=UPI002E31BC84|nr:MULTISPECIES: hypothetical protein [unclassified Streptomyces]WUC62751.1 hypothetical protein OG861_00065 [Streptomyces sp. NBC_00539]
MLAFCAPVCAAAQLVRAAHVVLTNADNGRTVSAHAGDEVKVDLTGYRGNGLTYSWSIPVSGDSTVLRRTGGRTTPTGSATARFHAEKDGTATLSAQRHCRPGPGRICPLVVTPWKATVEVR